jgi:hypothetical protein
MKIKALFNASLEVFREVHPLVLEQRFLDLPDHDQRLILSIATVLIMSKPDVMDFLFENAAANRYGNLPEC